MQMRTSSNEETKNEVEYDELGIQSKELGPAAVANVIKRINDVEQTKLGRKFKALSIRALSLLHV